MSNGLDGLVSTKNITARQASPECLAFSIQANVSDVARYNALQTGDTLTNVKAQTPSNTSSHYSYDTHLNLNISIQTRYKTLFSLGLNLITLLAPYS